MGGKSKKAAESFIDDVPDSKLDGLQTQAGTIHKDTNFRLDMQGMTSDQPQKHNLQVQVNNGTKITSLKKVAPATIATAIVAPDAGAAAIKQKLKDTISV